MVTAEELLKSKGIDYKYSGNDLVVKCLNPEHDDTHPSMRIDKLTGTFNCFSCGYSGNIFNLFGLHRNLLDVRVEQVKEKIKKLQEKPLFMPLSAEPFEQEYRGISAETFKHFKAFTLPGDKEMDGRVIFPITDIADNIIAFHGRLLYSEVGAKYLNRPSKVSLPLFPSKPKIIADSIILVEGIFDMLNLYDKGLTNAVCSFGASLTSKKGNKKLREKFTPYKLQGVSKLYIMFDGDTAGRTKAKEVEKAISNMFIVEILELPDNTDPGSLGVEDIEAIKEYIDGKYQ